ncbi:MAG: dioxygenase [Acidimicrobiales bacterium]
MTTPPRRATPERHLAEVLASMEGARTAEGADRGGELARAAVTHLFAFMADVGLTHDEWLAGIRFLTAVGQACEGDRQEFILLSDVLGASSLLEVINEHPDAAATEPTVLGPFYVAHAPERAYGDSIVDTVDDPEVGGEPLTLEGVVRDAHGRPVADAVVEVWEVQPNGRYDVEESPPHTNLRGTFRTNREGRYQVRTVRPVDYTIPDDGPVGGLLRALGRHPWRPAHIHLRVTAPGHRTLVTHVFDADSGYLDSDAVFGVRPSLVTSMAGGRAEFDVTLSPT